MRKQVIKMKVCVIGSPAAGKTSLIQRLIQEDQPSQPTEEYEVSMYCLDVKDAIMEIQLWDCCNQHLEYHKHLRQAFFRNTSAALLVFDITQSDWQQTAHNWISEAYDNQCYLVYAIATKIQLLDGEHLMSIRNSVKNRGSVERPLIGVNIQQLKEEAAKLFKKYEIRVHFLQPTQSIHKHFQELFARMHDQSLIVSRGSIARGMQLPFMMEEEETLNSKNSKENTHSPS